MDYGILAIIMFASPFVLGFGILGYLAWEEHKKSKQLDVQEEKAFERFDKVIDRVTTELDSKLNKWQQVTKYFRSKTDFTRKQMLSDLNSGYSKDYTRWDEYRCVLMRAGYLKSVGPGKYVRVKHIPVTLTYKQAREQAYGKREKKQTKRKKRRTTKKR